MSTTQRSESMNSFFDGYVHAKTSLKEFVDQYDSALRDKYEKEAQADFESFYTKPVLKTHFVKVDGSIITFAVKERVIGILCKHSLCVLNDHMDEIPSQYILLRWKKDFKRKYVSNLCSKNVQAVNPVQRYDVLYPQALQILDEGVISEASYNIVLEGLQELLKKVQKTNDNCYNNGNMCGDVETNVISNIAQQDFTGYTKICDPLKAKRPGRPKKNRLQSSSERNIKKNGKKQNDVSGPPKVGKPHDTQLIAIETQHFADEHSTQEGIRQKRQIASTHSNLDGQYNMASIVNEPPSFRNFIRYATYVREVKSGEPNRVAGAGGSSSYDGGNGSQGSVLWTLKRAKEEKRFL
ncbi:hypothetical protein HHK36_033339 [Tetracentron sinense]|uniref:Protein FAR1-RELATED SEQUENCE n=1 Tax=Tetracentron sinense TaxID=13715 RepID=A0A834Y5X3_TETSI|nr:hypothetical protein HHK36_033339 [Tetracentron sinense]